jgi:hypothetical protein
MPRQPEVRLDPDCRLADGIARSTPSSSTPVEWGAIALLVLVGGQACDWAASRGGWDRVILPGRSGPRFILIARFDARIARAANDGPSWPGDEGSSGRPICRIRGQLTSSDAEIRRRDSVR